MLQMLSDYLCPVSTVEKTCHVIGLVDKKRIQNGSYTAKRMAEDRTDYQ